MAEITNLTKKNMVEEESGEQETSSAAPKRKNWIIIGIIILLIILSVLAGLIFMAQTSTQEKNIKEQAGPGTNLPNLESDFNPTEGIFEQNPLFTEKLEFTINLADGRRYLLMSVQIGLSEEETLEYIITRLPIVKDIIITTTQSLSSDDFRVANGVEVYKRTLLLKLNSTVFTSEFKSQIGDIYPIKRILFDKFVLQ